MHTQNTCEGQTPGLGAMGNTKMSNGVDLPFAVFLPRTYKPSHNKNKEAKKGGNNSLEGMDNKTHQGSLILLNFSASIYSALPQQLREQYKIVNFLTH